jgi:hypothetical protein
MTGWKRLSVLNAGRGLITVCYSFMLNGKTKFVYSDIFLSMKVYAVLWTYG